MNARYFVAVLAWISCFGLSCSKEPENIALCKKAMKMSADQLEVDEQQRKKYIEACAGSGGGQSVEVWQCVIAEMKQQKTYVEATEKCGIK